MYSLVSNKEKFPLLFDFEYSLKLKKETEILYKNLK